MKMHNYLNAALFFSLFPTISNCEAVAAPNSQAFSKSLVVDDLNIESHSFVLVEFAENSSHLNQKAQQQLLDILKDDKSTPQLKQVIVLSWSDEEYPSTSLGEFPMHQRDLAEKRNSSISDFIQNIRHFDIDAYNMALHPNALEKWFNTSDNRLKNSFIKAGLPTKTARLGLKGKPSKAFILVK